MCVHLSVYSIMYLVLHVCIPIRVYLFLSFFIVFFLSHTHSTVVVLYAGPFLPPVLLLLLLLQLLYSSFPLRHLLPSPIAMRYHIPPLLPLLSIPLLYPSFSFQIIVIPRFYSGQAGAYVFVCQSGLALCIFIIISILSQDMFTWHFVVSMCLCVCPFLPSSVHQSIRLPSSIYLFLNLFNDLSVSFVSIGNCFVCFI